MRKHLRRWRLFNRAFDSDVRVEGFIKGDKPDSLTGKLSIGTVTSQPWLESVDKLLPNPSEERIADYMKHEGFILGKNDYEWYRPFDGIYVADAHEKNFVVTKEGVKPVDLYMTEFTQEELRAMGLKTK